MIKTTVTVAKVREHGEFLFITDSEGKRFRVPTGIVDSALLRSGVTIELEVDTGRIRGAIPVRAVQVLQTSSAAVSTSEG